MLAAMTRVLLTELDTAGHAMREAMLLSRLHAEEQARYRSFSSESRRQSWLAGRALLLTALDGGDPSALRTAASGGVMYQAAPLHLNLSHSGAFLAAVVSPQPVGIDIERIRPRAVATQADRVFCPDEAQAMDNLPEDARLERFFQLWTLKEAASKAAGLSIWDGLAKACFDLGTGGCRFAPPFPLGPWRLVQGGFDGDWRLAVALHGAPLELTCQRGSGSAWDSFVLAHPKLLQSD